MPKRSLYDAPSAVAAAAPLNCDPTKKLAQRSTHLGWDDWCAAPKRADRACCALSLSFVCVVPVNKEKACQQAFQCVVPFEAEKRVEAKRQKQQRDGRPRARRARCASTRPKRRTASAMRARLARAPRGPPWHSPNKKNALQRQNLCTSTHKAIANRGKHS